MEDGGECFDDVAALLADGGGVGTQVAEDLGPLNGAEAARHLLLDLHHPQIALGLVVVERDGGVGHEAQVVVGVLSQAYQQPLRRRALDATVLGGAELAQVDRIGLSPDPDQLIVPPAIGRLLLVYLFSPGLT